jgi:hypothetical protein
MRAVDHCITYMQYTGAYADMYCKKFLQYLNQSIIFEEC